MPLKRNLAVIKGLKALKEIIYSRIFARTDPLLVAKQQSPADRLRIKIENILNESQIAN